MLAVEAVQVYKLYKGSNYAPLNNVSVDVEPGQIFTLLGRNGAGKTTFVRICATQLAPTRGIRTCARLRHTKGSRKGKESDFCGTARKPAIKSTYTMGSCL